MAAITKTYAKALKLAENMVMKHYPCNINRKWLASSIDPYKERSERVTLIIREGSPSKGFILVDHGCKKILVFTVHLKKIGEITWEGGLA